MSNTLNKEKALAAPDLNLNYNVNSNIIFS